MAKPIPADLDLRNLSKDLKPEETFLDATVNKLSRGNGKDLVLGTISGWVVGVGVIKVGKTAAVGLGGSILLLHFATELGYLCVNWEKVREAMGHSHELIDKVLRFVRKNSCFSVGFVGGFFFGVARGSKPVQTVTPTTDDRPPPQSTESIPPLVSSTPSQLPPPSMLPPSVPSLQSVPSTIPIAAIQPMLKSSEPFKPEESSTASYPEKPKFVPPKPISQSPKISPSSIPNPSPSVTTTKPVQLGYANYGCYMYSVPMYSAFQPVSYPVVVQPNTTPPSSDQPTTNESLYSQTETKDAISVASDGKADEKPTDSLPQPELKSQTDFEEHFTPKVVPAVTEKSVSESNESLIDNKDENVSCPVTISMALNKDSNKKGTAERFSLKTSIPISKIDMKCVTSSSEGLQSSLIKKPFNPAFHTSKTEPPKIEIQSNVLINEKSINDVNVPVSTNSISTLITAAEVISQAETQFRRPELKPDLSPEQSTDQACMQPPSLPPRTIFNPINLEATKPNCSSQSQDRSHNEQKNQILLIQNKNSTNQKMLLAIQQQNPQVLLQRTSIDQKNSQVPSRPSSQTKKCKEELVNDNGTSSKVVSLKRMHQDDCDENDFENLITENQIYGNKIVVKEKSQGTLQEQEIKNKNKTEKTVQPQSKNVVLQPNFVYLSNVQFPANVMMIKNNVKVNNECVKTSTNEKKHNIDVKTIPNTNEALIKSSTTKEIISENKEIHILKSSNNVVHKLPNKNSKTDIVFQTPNPKVIMNPQIVYQVPMIIDRDNKLNQHPKRDETKMLESNTEVQNHLENTKPNDKVFITCQMDAKLQPKILITNIRQKLTVTEEVSALDLYEKRKRLRRLKYLTYRDFKEPKKIATSSEIDNTNNIITPEKIIVEIYNEFVTKKSNNEEVESESDYEGDDILDYNKVIEEYRPAYENSQRKREFLANFRLATFNDFKEREMDRQERIITKDAVASAYISAGRIDCLSVDNYLSDGLKTNACDENTIPMYLAENGVTQQRKQIFLARLKLTPVSKKNRDDYEKIWQEVIKERKRREKPSEHSQTKQRKLETDNINLDTSDQLKLITEIKKHVNENNNLIKKKMDSHSKAGDSIKVLAERNFSELNRLSKIADISVKHFSGQDCILKRDLTPGFDSENIQTATQPRPNYIHIKIPNIYKTTRVSETIVTDTSIDETKNDAREELLRNDGEKVRDASCQASSNSWQNVEALIRSYKEYDAARKKEISELKHRNTTLRVESAYVTRNASRDSDGAKALLAERKNLAQEEAAVRQSIQKIYSALEVIKSCQTDKLQQPS